MDNDGCGEYTTRLNNAFRRASIAIVGEENYELYCNKDKSFSIRNNIDEHHQRRDLKLNSEEIKKQQMIEEFILQEQKKQLSSRFDENSVDKEGINPIQDDGDGDADDETDIYLFANNKDQDRRRRERSTSTNNRPSVRYTEKDLEMNHEITSTIDDVLKEISLDDRETSMKLSDFLVKHLLPKK